ncbi:uncharacterized protein LOC133880008 isoform X3 [Alnus glutinosa]|uniref:uncharacterized protein LOC133880008 isoform X3 n=1 Tax=Alnus glutinosa TaxID=3517 RepID=UPI002D78789B|nr:uncharacterized protein LOC133880008 isoform X3 [Alnus glutinosa]
MGFWSSLPRLRSCSRRFVYSTSRRSRSTEFGTTEAGVTSHVFPSNSSRLRNPIFLSLLGISAGTVALQSQPSLAFCSFLYNDTKTAMLENEGMQTNDSCSDFGDFLEQFLDVSVPDFSSNNDLIQQYPSNEDGQDTVASPTNEDSNEGNEQKTAFETKQGRPKTSVVWTAFEEVFAKDGTVTKVKCKSCPAVFRPSKSSSTTHLRRHMNNCCTNNIASKNKQKVDQIEAAKPANGATQINNNHELNIDDIRDTARALPLGISSGALTPQSQPSTSFCHNNPNHEDQYQLDTNTAMLENEGMQTNDSCSDFGDFLEQFLDVSVPDTGFLGNGGMQNNDYYGNDILNTITAEAPVERFPGEIVRQLNRSQPSPSLCDYNPNHENQNQPNTNNTAMLKNGGMQTNDYCPGDEVQQRDSEGLFDSPRNNNALNEAVQDTGLFGNGGMQNNDSYDLGNDIPSTNTGFEKYGYRNGERPWNEPDVDTSLLANGGIWTNHSNGLNTDIPNSDFSSSDDLIQRSIRNEAARGRPRSSPVWKFFAEEYDKDGTATHVKCKSCGTVLHRSKASSTTQMRTHLRTCGNGKNIASKNKQKVDQIKPPQEKRKKQVATFMQIKGKKRGTKSKLIHEFSPISDVVELKRPPSSRNSNSNIRNVMEHVCTLEGVEEGSFLYRIATHIFHNEEKREMFVVIEKPHLQLMFLKGEAELLTRRFCSIRLASG